jgi:ELWxxDGT repeat protein
MPVLLASDGSEAGTTIISYLPTREYPARVDRIAQTDHALVMGIRTTEHGMEPWITDGTSEGTHLLKDIHPGPESGLSSGHGAVLPDGTILLEGDELWRTDGTDAGTRIACDVSGEGTASSPDIICVNNGFAVFRAKGHDGGLALWRTKGTQESTSLLRKLYPVNASRWFIPRGRIADGLAYDASTTVPQDGRVLFTDGTYLGTKCLSGPPGSVVYTDVPKRLGDSYYLSGQNVWKPKLYRFVDGQGPLQEIDLPLSNLRTETLVASTRRHRLYFVGNDMTGVRNLWESDGTTSGTIPWRNFM